MLVAYPLEHLVLYIHDTSIENIVSLKEPGLSFIFFNSAFTLRRVSEFLHIAHEIVYPVFNPNQYRTYKGIGTLITMINPTEQKGGKIFKELCRMLPGLSFQVVSGWSRSTMDELNFSNVKKNRIWCGYEKGLLRFKNYAGSVTMGRTIL